MFYQVCLTVTMLTVLLDLPDRNTHYTVDSPLDDLNSVENSIEFE